MSILYFAKKLFQDLHLNCLRIPKTQIRLAEAQLQGDQQSMKPEQVEKMRKMDGWREELKLLEDRKVNLV